jgi:hypothetical protein
MRQVAIVERNQFWFRRPKPVANFVLPISFCRDRFYHAPDCHCSRIGWSLVKSLMNRHKERVLAVDPHQGPPSP